MPLISRTCLRTLSNPGILTVLAYLSCQQEGGEPVDIVLAFLVAVGANVLSYFVCKRLDRHGDKAQ